MAKTFDNISEASATNYLFLFAQRTLALQNEPPTPPPLNALGLPGLFSWLFVTLTAADEEEAKQEQRRRRSDDPEAAATVTDFAEKVAPLAKQITEYILDHQDDAAQEARWRTTMKRDMGKSFRKVKAGVLKVESGQAEVQQRFEEMHTKVEAVNAEMQSQQVKILERLDRVLLKLEA